jgi:hypothetical protein
MTSESNPAAHHEADHPDQDDGKVEEGRGAEQVEDLPVAAELGQPTGEDQAAVNREDDPPA